MSEERILQEAARRFARLQAHDCTPEEREQASAWETQDPAHREASELAGRVAADIERMAGSDELSRRLKALADEAFAAYAQPEHKPARAMQKRRRWQLGAGLAASVALAVVALHHWNERGLGSAQPVAYATGNHERRSVTLEDGSVVELDIDTQIAVRMSEKRRQIELLRGRALFDVAHDSGRPFSVSAGGSRTTALGTQFQVQRQEQQVVVTLAEGSVAVDGEDDAVTAGWHERLSPGEQMSIDTATSRRSRHMVDTQLVTSWSLGRHVFRGTPLHDALDEVNRYAMTKVRLGDPALADMPVAGNFVAGDSEVVVAAFAAVLPLRVVRSGDREIILFRRYTE